ncbi:MAG: hypothetical protein JRI95_16725 [Deltaproteobacteria bacterium]|nr:hypothetical protein [Deltaproteobacteria bacterium]
MGGWITIIGEVPDFNDRLAGFQRIFSVEGVPDLRVETHQHSNQARTVAWAWNKFHVPDVYVQETDQGDICVLCGAVTDLGHYGVIQSEPELTAVRVLDLWVQHQDKLIEQLNGSFSCLFYDEKTNYVTLFTDRFASRSVWFTEENGIWIVGNYPSAIATFKKSKPKINPVGLWSLFNTGRHVGGQGLYANIHCLSAGENVILTVGKQTERGQWHRRKYQPDHKVTPREWGRRISQTLQASSSRLHKTCAKPHIFLSGGLDSRVAAAAFGKPLKSVSLCTKPNAETRLASMVSKALGIDHEIIIRSPYWYLDTLNAAALISSGNFLTCHTHFIVPASHIASTSQDAEFLLGDLLENLNKHYFTLPNGHQLAYGPENMKTILHTSVPYSMKDIHRLGVYFKEEIRSRIEEAYMEALQYYTRSLLEVSEDDADRLDTFLRWPLVSPLNGNCEPVKPNISCEKRGLGIYKEIIACFPKLGYKIPSPLPSNPRKVAMAGQAARKSTGIHRI